MFWKKFLELGSSDTCICLWTIQLQEQNLVVLIISISFRKLLSVSFFQDECQKLFYYGLADPGHFLYNKLFMGILASQGP